jgi:DNA repair protein RadC
MAISKKDYEELKFLEARIAEEKGKLKGVGAMQKAATENASEHSQVLVQYAVNSKNVPNSIYIPRAYVDTMIEKYRQSIENVILDLNNQLSKMLIDDADTGDVQ